VPDHRISQRPALKGHLHLERHGGNTAGVITRIPQRIFALTAAIWHHDRTGQSAKRSPIAHDTY
jgi:hypothetical protein